MDLLHFHKMRTAIQDNASPGSEHELTTVEARTRELLLSSGLFEEVEVGRTDDRDQLVIALCRFRPLYTEYDVAARLEMLWNDRLRYPFWEAHTLQVDEGFIELEAATRESSVGHYVTVHLVAQQAVIPAQRTPED